MAEGGRTNSPSPGRRDMLDVIEHRDRRASTLIASQIPVERWHDLVGEGTIADAIVDRIVSYAHAIALTGDSLREAPPGPGRGSATLRRRWPPDTRDQQRIGHLRCRVSTLKGWRRHGSPDQGLRQRHGAHSALGLPWPITGKNGASHAAGRGHPVPRVRTASADPTITSYGRPPVAAPRK